MRVKRAALGSVIFAFVSFAIWAGTLYLDGYRAYVVRSGSMSPTIQAGDLIIDRPASGHFVSGDVLTFRHSASNDLVTHRATRVTPQGIKTKGDGNRTTDVWTIRPEQVVGVVASTLPHLGYVVVFMQQPTGVAGTMSLGLSLLLLWGLFFPSEPASVPPRDHRYEDGPGACRRSADRKADETGSRPEGDSD